MLSPQDKQLHIHVCIVHVHQTQALHLLECISFGGVCKGSQLHHPSEPARWQVLEGAVSGTTKGLYELFLGTAWNAPAALFLY